MQGGNGKPLLCSGDSYPAEKRPAQTDEVDIVIAKQI